MSRYKILVTGCAGFIGSHLVDRLLKEGHPVCGIDNFDPYYDRQIKKNNLKDAAQTPSFHFYEANILDFPSMGKIFIKEKPQKIVHLAAKVGVRPSIVNPQIYSQVNVAGTVNLLKLAAGAGIKQFIFASSSSVYGQSPKIPFSEEDPCGAIISPYGASKRSAEFFLESFHNTWGLKSVILRFFTVYGPRGRPDMAPALFTKAILKDKLVNQFGDGSSSRDYTYIDDIIDGIVRVLGKNFAFEVINLGNNYPVLLSDFIAVVQEITGKMATIKKLPRQVGDVEKTWANIDKAKKLLGWEPKTRLVTGLKHYFEWLK